MNRDTVSLAVAAALAVDAFVVLATFAVAPLTDVVDATLGLLLAFAAGFAAGFVVAFGAAVGSAAVLSCAVCSVVMFGVLSIAAILCLKCGVDLQQRGSLPFSEGRIGCDGRGHGLIALSIGQNPGLHVQGFRGDPQALGDAGKDFGTGLAQPPLHLAQVGVGNLRSVRELPQ